MRWVHPIWVFILLLRNLLLWLVPFYIFLLVLFIPIYFFKGNLDSYIRLGELLIWPLTTLIALFFFRKVVTYLFFSMDEFSFFGLKGSLKDVRTMVNEKAEELWKKDKEKKQLKRERKEHKIRLSEIKDEKIQVAERADKAVKLANELFNNNEKLRKHNNELIKAYHVLSERVKLADNISGESINTGQNGDIGSINPTSESSEKIN